MNLSLNKIVKEFINIFHLFSLVLILSLSSQSFAQNEKSLAKAEKKARKDSTKQEKVRQGKYLVSPLIVPAYTPELGGMIAVGALQSFKTNKSDSLIQRSSFPITAGYTTTGAVVFMGILTTHWWQDKMRIYGDYWYKDMPDNYWGVGYENGFTTPVSDSTTAFNREWWWFRNRFLFRAREFFYFGVNQNICQEIYLSG